MWDIVGFLIAAAIIVLILMLKISVSLRHAEDLSLAVMIGFIKLGILPSKEKELRLSDYKIKKFRKIQAKKAKKELEAAEKARIKNEKKKLSKTTKKVNAAKKKSEDAEKPKKDIGGLIHILTETAKTFIMRFGKHLGIRVRKFKIVIGSEDAAKTAVTYGAVCGAVQCFFELIYNNTSHLKLPKNSDDLAVVPDFTAENITAEIDISFSFRVWQIFDMLIRTAFTFIKNYLNKE